MFNLSSLPYVSSKSSQSRPPISNIIHPTTYVIIEVVKNVNIADGGYNIHFLAPLLTFLTAKSSITVNFNPLGLKDSFELPV